jgi:hypothetical protein
VSAVPLPNYRATGEFMLPGIAFTVDCRSEGGQYISVECQAGAHHGCPGGIRETGGAQALVCDCPAVGCDCRRPLRLHAVPDLAAH